MNPGTTGWAVYFSGSILPQLLIFPVNTGCFKILTTIVLCNNSWMESTRVMPIWIINAQNMQITYKKAFLCALVINFQTVHSNNGRFLPKPTMGELLMLSAKKQDHIVSPLFWFVPTRLLPVGMLEGQSVCEPTTVTSWSKSWNYQRSDRDPPAICQTNLQIFEERIRLCIWRNGGHLEYVLRHIWHKIYPNGLVN